MCRLQAHGMMIQHAHYDLDEKASTTQEFSLPEWKQKRVDGYYVDSHGHRVVVEFLGDEFHGHPSRWGPDGQKRNLFGVLHTVNFEKTEKTLAKVASFGYIVRYVWESDYRKLKPSESPLSILREFSGKLEW